MSQTSRICVGAITGAYGVRGEVRIKSFCAEPTAIADYAPLSSEDGKTQYSLTISSALKGGLAVRLGGVTSKEQADAMKGNRLYANRADLPSLPDDEFYHTDLIGLEALDTGGNLLGRVTAVHNHGAGDVLEISGPKINGSELVPFTKDTVPTIDTKMRRLIVDLPDGQFAGANDR